MLYNQIQFTIRRLLRTPLISVINLSGLALGIACAYLGITYASQELSYDREFADSDRIYRVGVDFMNMGGFAVGPEYLPEYLQTHSDVIEASTRISVRGNINLVEKQKSVSALLVGCDSAFFQVFNFPVVKGPQSKILEKPDQVVVSEDFAMRWFGSTEVLGRAIEIPIGEEKRTYSISALVNNKAFQTHLVGDIWVPIQPFLTGENSWYSASFYTYFKLKSAKDFEIFAGELESIRRNEIYANYIKSSGVKYEKWTQRSDAYQFIIHPLADVHLKSTLNFEMSPGGNLQKTKGFLLIGLLVLLVAIANYINLSTARSYTRVKEIGVKKSLGVRKPELIRQFIGESILESIFVVVLAGVFMNVILKLFDLWTGSSLLLATTFDFRHLVLFLAFTTGVAILASLYPAFYLSAIKPTALLNNVSQQKGKINFRNILVIVQFAVTTGLIFGSLVIFGQLKYVDNKDLGFNKEGLMVVRNLQELENSAETFRQELAGNPLVVNSSFANSLPGSTNLYQSSFKTPEMENSVPLRVLPVDADFIETMGMTLIEGSNFTHRTEPDSTVAIINETAMKTLGLKDPIGAEIASGKRVIGVVSDFHIESLKEGIQPVVMEQATTGNTLTLRLTANSGAAAVNDLVDQADHLWQELRPGSALQYSFIDETFARFAEQERIESKGILALTVMALLIACLGLFGLTTFSVKRREKEIGIRKILGSTITGIVRLLSSDYLILIFLALVISLPVSWYLMRNWLDNFAYRIDLHWWIFGLAGLASIFIAITTIGVQGIKAAMANPSKVLRNE